jgi:hypothetical protein
MLSVDVYTLESTEVCVKSHKSISGSHKWKPLSLSGASSTYELAIFLEASGNLSVSD